MGVLTTVITLAIGLQPASEVYSKPIVELDLSTFASAHEKLLKAPPREATGMAVHKISYPSPNSPAGHRRLSGALFLPTGLAPRGLVLYCHGTIATRDAVGSRAVEHSLGWAMPYVAAGFAVAMPDYIGLGDSKAVHPYPLGKINAWSAIDLLGPARQVGTRLGRDLASLPTFLSGYSEGGAVAMWVARHAQENPRLGVTFRAIAPQSGPYDLSETTIRSTISDQSNPLYRAARKMLIGYVGYSAQAWVPGAKLTDIFVPSFASYVPLAFRTSKDDGEITTRLVNKAMQIRPGARSVRPLIQPAQLRAIERKDRRNPLFRALLENDTYDWAPRTPMRLYAIEKDYIVDHNNTKKALNAMRRRGVGPDTVTAVILPDPGLNHVSAEAPIAKLSAEWFLTFL